VQFFQEINIPDEWRSTGGADAKPFLVYDNGPAAANRMLAFASYEGLKPRQHSALQILYCICIVFIVYILEHQVDGSCCVYS